MADLLLGPCAELWIAPPGGAFAELTRPRHRWLTWDPTTRRLWLVARLGPARRAPVPQDVRRVRGFFWSPAAEVELVEVQRPQQEAAAVELGELDGVCYLAAKGQAPLAEWIHWFTRLPVVLRDPDGEWYLEGAVDVDERGILS